jgi:hypothetical protein
MDLAYARAAAVVRALPYRLGTRPMFELRNIPFIGASVHAEIQQMVSTGTSKNLDAHRLGKEGGGVLMHASTGQWRSGFWAVGVGGGGGGGDLTVRGTEGAGGVVAVPPGGGVSTVSSLSLLKPGTIDEAAAQKSLRKLPSLGANTGRVALTPGCQIDYMLSSIEPCFYCKIKRGEKCGQPYQSPQN